MTLFDEVKEKLETDPNFRERRFRREGIVQLLREKFPIAKMLSDSTLADFIHEAENIGRYVRMAQSKNPHLQGKDYKDKDYYEQKVEVKLGYQAGFRAMSKEVMRRVEKKEPAKLF